MTNWILSIVGMVFIGVILEAVIPDGKTNAFIKAIFSIIFMVVVISPIINLFGKDNVFDFSEILKPTSEVVEQNEHELMELKFIIENHLIDNGIHGVEVKVKGYSSNNDLKIEQINVNLSNLIINKKDEHIDKYKLITTLIKEKVEVNEEQIVYG